MVRNIVARSGVSYNAAAEASRMREELLLPNTIYGIKNCADERGKKSVRLVYLKTRTEPHIENLRDDYNRLAVQALDEKKADIIQKWFANKIATYYIMVDDDYKGCASLQRWMQNAASTAK